MGLRGLEDGPPGPWSPAWLSRIIVWEGLIVDQELLDDIKAVMQAPIEPKGGEGRARVERVLTDGYAHALVLEGERLQIERQIGAVTARIGDGEGNGLVVELSELSRRLSLTDRTLAELRGLLASLRDTLRR
jgi:hypothetical protein